MVDTVNVLAPELRNRIKRFVDFIPNAWVEFYDDITVSAIKLIQESQKDQNITSNLQVIADQISDWNFTDSQGEKIQTSADGLTRLPLKLLTWISQQTADILDPSKQEDKKKE